MYTKGKWKVKIDTSINTSQRKYIVGDIAGVRVDICQICFTSIITKEEREANAHLISAAPELLKALKLARERISDDDKNWDVPKIIDKAIAKATKGDV